MLVSRSDTNNNDADTTTRDDDRTNNRLPRTTTTDHAGTTKGVATTATLEENKREQDDVMSKVGTITDPNKNDVLCGRGWRINSHVGNVQFRSIIQSKKFEYLVQTTPAGKILIVNGILNTIRAQNPAGRFLQLDKNTGLWFEIGDAQAYTKTGQGLREGAPARTAASHIVDSKKTTTTTTV